MVVLKWIDYIWFVGESFHRREKSPGDGAALIMWCWYLDVVIMLLPLFHRIVEGWIFFLLVVPLLLPAPFLFCRSETRQSVRMKSSQGIPAERRDVSYWRYGLQLPAYSALKRCLWFFLDECPARRKNLSICPHESVHIFIPSHNLYISDIPIKRHTQSNTSTTSFIIVSQN